jgi:hypothetical protein
MMTKYQKDIMWNGVVNETNPGPIKHWVWQYLCRHYNIPSFCILPLQFNERGYDHYDHSSFYCWGGYGLFYGINLSVAVAVGFIALFRMAIETPYVDDYL